MLAALACDPLSESGGRRRSMSLPSKDSVKHWKRQQQAELKLQETRLVSLQVSPHVVP